MKGDCEKTSSQLSVAETRDRQSKSCPNDHEPMTILLVDDSTSTSLVLKHSIEKNKSFKVHVFNRPEIMAASIEFLEFDLALIDIHMPKLDGPGLIERIRLHPRHQQTPILMMSSDTSPEMHRAASESGAIGILAKPIKLKFFPEILAGIIHSNRNSTG